MADVVIIAALDREVESLVGRPEWRASRAVPSAYGCFERTGAAVVCAGIGGRFARRAAEDAIGVWHPGLLVSAGLAGALTPAGKIGQVVFPVTVVDAANRERFQAYSFPDLHAVVQEGELVSSGEVAGLEGKRALARQHAAQWVDMEAAAVARVAGAHGLPFLAIKAISDEYDFPVPSMNGLVDESGRFRTGWFVLRSALRPSAWPALKGLASNTRKASRELCDALHSIIEAALSSTFAECGPRGTKRGEDEYVPFAKESSRSRI